MACHAAGVARRMSCRMLSMARYQRNGTLEGYSWHQNSNLPNVDHAEGMKDLNKRINFWMKLLNMKRRCRKLELRDQTQPTKLDPLLGNKLPLPSLTRETTRHKMDLVLKAWGLT
ncbi:hypothetical protein HAX54_007896 [Datura stramonium]|uniref:Uncharacterized protein n=1 Tax=Datura stramonium TaxID=4076 RepID=A0ABS8WY29_DATST|nr:hypothetical protein [Datura stramonium]